MQFEVGVDHPAAHWSHKAPVQRGKQSQVSGTLQDPMWHPALQMAGKCHRKPDYQETHATSSPRPAILACIEHKLVPLLWNCKCTRWKQDTRRSHTLDHRPLQESVENKQHPLTCQAVGRSPSITAGADAKSTRISNGLAFDRLHEDIATRAVCAIGGSCMDSEHM